MKVYPLVLGPVQTSCYIISNHERAVVVDPAANANQIIQYLGMKKLKLEKEIKKYKENKYPSYIKDMIVEFKKQKNQKKNIKILI